MKSASKKKKISIILVAAASAATVLAAVVGLLIFTGVFKTGGPDIHGSSSGGLSDSTGEPEGPIILHETAPWKDGSLTLTTVTYASGQSTLSGGRYSSSCAAQGFDMLNLSEHNSDDQENSGKYVKTENTEVSIHSGTKVTSLCDGDLLRIIPSSGTHVNCDGVYYSIADDKEICLSCTIEDALKKTPYYYDAVVRCIIQEGLITLNRITAADTADLYEQYYNYLSASTQARSVVESGKKPTVSNLGLNKDGVLVDDAAYKLLEAFNYPVVKIGEYCANRDWCAFTLCSAVGSMTYGSYVIRFSTGEIRKLDGDWTGKALSTTAAIESRGKAALQDLDLSKAVGIDVLGDYDALLVTLPYFITDIRMYPHSPSRLQVRLGDYGVFIFYPQKGEYKAPVGTGSVPAEGAALPVSAARFCGSYAIWQNSDGTYSLYDGERIVVTDKEILCQVPTREDISLFLLREEDGPHLYRLTDTGLHPDVVFSDVLTPSVTYYADSEEGVRYDFVNGNRVRLWDKKPDVLAVSKDGRYFYYYYAGENEIFCLDAGLMETASVRIPERFTEEIASLDGIHCLLFLDRSEEKLILAYYRRGQLIFDREGFNSGSPFISKDFNSITCIFDYYRIDGMQAKIRNSDLAVAICKILAADQLFERKYGIKEATTKEIYADTAERLLPLLDYSAGVIFVSPETFLSFTGGLTADAVDSIFVLSNLTSQRSIGYYDFTIIDYPLVTDYNTYKEELDDELARDLLWLMTGYNRLYDYAPDHSEYWNSLENREYADSMILSEKKERLWYSIINEALNEGVSCPDQEQLRKTMQEEISARLKLTVCDSREGFPDCCIDPYELGLLFEAMICETVESTGADYSSVIREAAFLDYACSYGLFRSCNDSVGGVLRMGELFVPDSASLKKLLNGLDFSKGEIEIRRTGVLSTSFFEGYFSVDLLSVGENDGDYYAVIDGYYAVLSEDAYRSLYGVLGSGEQIERALYKDLEQLLHATSYAVNGVPEEEWIFD